MDQPTQSDLKSLLASIEEVQSKFLQTLGPNEQIKKGLAAELEPLKAPVFFLWELLGSVNQVIWGCMKVSEIVGNSLKYVGWWYFSRINDYLCNPQPVEDQLT